MGEAFSTALTHKVLYIKRTYNLEKWRWEVWITAWKEYILFSFRVSPSAGESLSPSQGGADRSPGTTSVLLDLPSGKRHGAELVFLGGSAGQLSAECRMHHLVQNTRTRRGALPSR